VAVLLLAATKNSLATNAEKIEQKIAKEAKKKNLPQRTPRTQRN